MSDALLENMFFDLEDALEQDALGNQKFLPLNSLDATITAERLKAALPTFRIGSLNLPTNLVQHARKIFAILLFIGEPLAIKELWKEGLRDIDLPLAAGAGPKTRGKLIAADGRIFTALKTAAKASEFLDKQWLVQAPVFGTTGQHFTLNTKCSMPLVSADEVGGGAYGCVYKCELHQAHQQGHQVRGGTTYVAVKQFKIKSSPEAFLKEKDNLKKLQDLENPHMIRHHVTCKVDNAYYVVFPWADGGNLSEYWELENHRLRCPELARWMLQQMFGIADALAALHDRNCRHGDLKPENILQFNSMSDPILVIGDVGVSRFHKQETSLRNDKTMTSATTPSYEAPEVYSSPQAPRSRKYDIWSLGCIFLEFTAWFLWNNNALIAFREKRVAPDKNSYFYNNGRLDVHPRVVDAISSLLGDSRIGPDTALWQLLILVRDDLLQVDVDRRPKADEVAAKLKNLVKQVKEDRMMMYKSEVKPGLKPEIFCSQSKTLSKHGSKDSAIEISSFSQD